MTNSKTWIPVSVNEVKAAYGFPADAVFMGYAVHLPESDEFLMSNDERRGIVARAWAKHPTMAKLFQDHRVAQRIVDDCDPGAALVVYLFDMKDRIFVAA